MQLRTLSSLLTLGLGIVTGVAVAATPTNSLPKFYNKTMTMTFTNYTTCPFTLRSSGAGQMCSGPSVVMPNKNGVFTCKQGQGLFLSVEGAQVSTYMTTLQLEHSNPQGYYYLGDIFDQGMVGYYVNGSELAIGKGFGDQPNSGLQDKLKSAEFTVVARGDFKGHCSN